MRKSAIPVPHPRFEFLKDVLPQTVKDLERALRQAKRPDLAEQVKELRIYGRCGCGARCGTFYCVPPDQYRRLAPFGSDMTHVVKESKGLIIHVETLDPAVDDVLQALFPDCDESQF